MDLSEAARQVLVYISPLIAAGALAKIGEDASDTASELLGRVWDTLARRLQGHKKAEAALTLYEDEPQNPALQQQVQQRVVEVFGQEPAAAQELLALAQAIAALNPPPVTQRQYNQNISGNANVGTAIAGDLHGNLTIGSLDMSRNKRISPGAPARAATPANPQPLTPRQHISDATLSADGVHFSYGHALIIGVGTYEHPYIPTVPTTAADARALAALLRNPALAAYPKAQVRVLTGAEATRSNIVTALEALADAAHGGTALIFFAGHGEPVGGSYALLPHDAQLGRLAETGLTAELFHAQVAKIRARARRLVVLLNCCHAGGIGDEVLSAGGSGLSGDAPPPDFYRPLSVGSGQVVISSSRPSQKSAARSNQQPQHSPFGAHLLDALSGKAPGSGAGVGVFELFAYLRAQVPLDAQHTRYNFQPTVQEPLFYASQLDDNVAVALRAGTHGDTLGAGLEQQVRRLAELELQIEELDSTAPPALLAERDGLLRVLTANA